MGQFNNIFPRIFSHDLLLRKDQAIVFSVRLLPPGKLLSVFDNVTSECDPAFVTFDTSVLTPHFFEMTDVHQSGKYGLLFSVCASRITSFFVFLLWSFAKLATVPASPIHCPQRLLQSDNFHRSEHSNELVHNIEVTQRLAPFLRNVILVLFRWSPFQTLSRRLMSFYDECMLCFSAFVGSAIDFSMLVRTLRLQLAGHSGFHWEFQLFPWVFLRFP